MINMSSTWGQNKLFIYVYIYIYIYQCEKALSDSNHELH